MWRFVALTGSIVLFISAPVMADGGASSPHYGVDIAGLPGPTELPDAAPDGHFQIGDATGLIIDGAQPPRATFDDEAMVLIPRSGAEVDTIDPGERTAETVRLQDVSGGDISYASSGEGETVIRIHEDGDGDDESVSTDEGETVIRIHEDGEHDAPEPGQIEGIDDEPDLTIENEDDEPEPQIPPLVTGYVDWEFIPVVEVLEATGGVTDIDAQRLLERDIDAIADCFEPDDYHADGAVDVDLHLAHTGRPRAVNGSTDGVAPAQARCILQRAWGYEFPRPAEMADEPSQVQYRVEFIGQTVDADAFDPGADGARFFLERLRLTDHPTLQKAAAESMVDHLDDAEYCAIETLDALPGDRVITEVNARWMRTESTHFRPTDLDITVSNETGTVVPPPNVVDCYKRQLRQFDFDVQQADVSATDLPDRIDGSFFVTLHPPGSTGP